jgi:DNA ligase (NAD+)
MPDRCPVCRSRVVREGAFTFCSSIGCPAQIRARILHLAQRRALDIDRLGPKYVDQLMAAGLLREVADVFFLPGKEEAILELPRWGPLSFKNLKAQIEKARRPELARFLFALGIRGVGQTTARDLAEQLGSLEALAGASEESLQEIEGIGPEVSRSIRAFFDLPENRAFLARLGEAGVEPTGPRGGEGALAGTVWCFTGRIEAFSRDRARVLVEQQGARTVNAISRKVTHLVAGPGAGAKLERARKLEIPSMDEQEFLELLREKGIELE